MNGARIAVFGLARSGLSVVKAAIALGAQATVVDEKPEDGLKSKATFEEAISLGAEVRLGWQGEFSDEFDFVVTSPGVPADHPKLQAAVGIGVPVLSEIEFAYRISRAPIVAITGTNGKSTTTAMTYSCLKEAGRKAVLCGNIYGSGFEEVPLTEAALSSSSDQVLVAEVSSFQLEWVSTFRPVAAAITNITPDHLDRHGSFEEYVAAKHRIFAAQTANDFAIVNADDPAIKAPAVPKLLTFGRHGKDATIDDGGLTILGHRINAGDLLVVGEHNFLNAAAAGLLSFAALGAKELPSAVIDGLKTFKGIAHRMEFVGEKGGVRIINNSMCTNPAAVINSSRSMLAKQHLLIGGINKKLDFAPVGAYLRESGNRAYLFGRDAVGIAAQMGGTYPVFERMADAFQDAIRNANAGEVIMLAPGCASMDQFRDFEDRGNVFKSVAKEWLES